MGRIVGATIDRDCRGTSPIESMATSVLATRVPVLNRRLTRPLFRLTIFSLTTAPIMGAGWEVEYFRAVEQPLRIHWTSKGLHIDCSRYTGLSNDSVCDSLAPVILSDDDPSRGIGRLVTWCADQGPDQRPCVKCEYELFRVNAMTTDHTSQHSNRCCVKLGTAVTSVRYLSEPFFGTAVTSVRNLSGLNFGTSGCVENGEFYCYPNSCYRFELFRVNATMTYHTSQHPNRCCVKLGTAVTSVRYLSGPTCGAAVTPVRNLSGLIFGTSGCVDTGEFYCYPKSCYRFGTDEFGTQEWGFVLQFTVVLLWTLCCWALRWYIHGNSGRLCPICVNRRFQRSRVLHTRVTRANNANLLRGLGGLKMQNLLVLTLILFLPLVSGADNDGLKGDRWRPPQFSGTRDGFQKWWLAFVAWLAYVAATRHCGYRGEI